LNELALAEPDAEVQTIEEPEAGLTPERALELALSAHRASTDYFDTNIRGDLERDLRQWQSLHPVDSKYLSQHYAGRSRIMTPKTRASVIKSEAAAAEAFFSSVEIVNIAPDDKDDPQSVASAAFYQALVQKRLADSDPKTSVRWFLTCMGAFQESHVAGVTVARVYWDFQKRRGIDRPCIDLLPIENFRFDPASDWRDPIGSSPYLINLMPMYLKDIRLRIKEGKYLPIDDTKLQAAATQRWDSVRLTRQGVNRTDPQDVSHAINDFSVVWVHENIVEVDGQDWIFDTVGTDHLLSTPVPIESRYRNGRSAYVVGFATIEAHKHYPSGIPRLTRELVREHNEIRNKRVDALDFAINPRYLVKRNKQVDLASLRRTIPGVSTLVDDVDKDVREMQSGSIPNAAFTETEHMVTEFDDLAGLFSPSSVQNNRALNETVGGMKMINANADQVTAYRLKTFVETWVEPVLRQVVALERDYESDPRIIAAAVMAAGIQWLDDSLWEGDFNLQVNIGMGASNPTERANLFLFGLTSVKNLLSDGLLARMGANAATITKEVFAMLGWRDGSRFFSFPEEDQVIADLVAQIEQLQQQMEQKSSPELIRAQVDRTIAETLVKRMEVLYSATQASQAVATVPQLAPVADAMLGSIGFVDQNPAPIITPPTGPVPGLTQDGVKNPYTGVGFTPGDAGAAEGGEDGEGGEKSLAAGNTNPSKPKALPKPGSGLEGAKQGIETQRAD
jgi:hypothetical protein